MVLGKCPETVYKTLSIAFFLLMSPHHHVVNNRRPSRLLPDFSHVLFPRPGILVTSHYLVITSLSSCLSPSGTPSGRLLRLSRRSQDFLFCFCHMPRLPFSNVTTFMTQGQRLSSPQTTQLHGSRNNTCLSSVLPQ